MGARQQYNKNSLESYIADLMRREANVIAILTSLSSLYTDGQSQITINFENADGTSSPFVLPSYNYLISEVRRVEANINQILTSTATSATLTLPDGTTKVLYQSNTLTEPAVTISLATPFYFVQKNNKLADKLLSPNLCMQLAIDPNIRKSASQILVDKVVLDLVSSDDIGYFNQNLKGKNILYSDLITQLSNRSIGYNEYNETIDVPFVTVKYNGNFDLLDISRTPANVLVGTTTIATTQIIYTLNTLHYQDVSSNNQDLILKVNDILVVNDGSNSTKYSIVSIDTTTNNVVLSLLQGSAAPVIGPQAFVIDQDAADSGVLEIPVSSNEYHVIFIKPINKYFDIVANDWGTGVGYYTSELVDLENQTLTLADVYATLINIESALSGIASENYIPLINGITPAAPLILPGNAQVQQSNAQTADQSVYNDLKAKIAQKNKLVSQIGNLDTQIATNKTSQQGATNAAIATLQQNINNLIANKETLSATYNTLVQSIVAEIQTLGTNSFTPTYEVRMFWAMPDPQYGDTVNKLFPQEVVQFEYQVRKLNPNNISILTQQIPYTDASGNTLTGVWSPWTSSKTVARTKVVASDGTVSWSIVDTTSADIVNPNQLSVSIGQGENVEIRVRSLSEAGYPGSPLMSDWSDSVIIPFPQELVVNTAFDLTSANNEAILAQFQTYLNSLGLNEHLADTFTVGTQTFKHEAANIGTSQRDTNNNVLSVDDVLNTQTNMINNVLSTINRATGLLSVEIQDGSGNVLAEVSNNSVVDLFAFYYTNAVESLTVKKGEVISKLFNLVLTNTGGADLELLSFLPGSQNDRLPGYDYASTAPYLYPSYPDESSIDPYISYIYNKTEYENYRKYFRVPMVIKSMAQNAALNTAHTAGGSIPVGFVGADNIPYAELQGFQSMQNKGQIIFSRYMDVSLANNLYIRDIVTPNNDILLPISSGTGTSYIWNESYTSSTPTGGGGKSAFCVHTDHPDIQAGTALMASSGIFASLYDSSTKVPTSNITTGINPIVAYPYFAHANYFNLQANDPSGNGKKQLEYIPYKTLPLPSTTGVLNFSRKLGFNLNDNYLIGKYTCGAYLFMLPPTTASIYSGSPVYNVGTTLTANKGNSIVIPVLFQARMTDYDGAGSTGVGIIGGFDPAGSVLTNLTYTKTLGLDILIKNQTDLFSFDLNVTAQYKPSTVSNLRYVSPEIQNSLTVVNFLPGTN